MKQYLKEMNAQFKYRANWEPNKPLAIGDIGILEKGVFSLRSTLEKEGLPMEVRTRDETGSLKYNSSGAVTINSKLAGQATLPNSPLGEADAGFSIQFSREKAIVFEVSSYKTHLIENVGEIEKLVLQKFMANQWSKNWLIITELVEADGATILISNSKESAIELKANADVAPGANINIADANLELGVVSNKGIGTEIVAAKGITPLYIASGIKKKIFGDASLAAKGELQMGLDVEAFDPAELE